MVTNSDDHRSLVSVALVSGLRAGVAQLAVLALTGPFLTAVAIRALDPGNASFWLVLVSGTAYLNLFDLGVSPTFGREVALRSADRTRRHELADLWRTARLLNGWALVVLTVAMLAATPWLVWALTQSAASGERTIAWVAFILGSALNLRANVHHAMATAMGSVAPPRRNHAITLAVGAVLSVTALLPRVGVLGLAGAWLAQNMLLLTLAHRASRNAFSQPSGRWSPVLARSLLEPALGWVAMQLGGTLIFASAPLLLAHFADARSVLTFVSLRQVISSALFLALLPAHMAEPFVSRWWTSNARTELLTILRVVVRSAVGVMLVTSLAMLLVGKTVFSAWVGAAHWPGLRATAVLCACYCFEAHHVSLALVGMATGEVLFSGAALLAGAFTIGLATWWVPTHGILGMCAAIAGAQLLTNNWWVPWRVLRLLRLSPVAYLRLMVGSSQ